MGMATGIYFIVDGTVHRGYRDESGRFTLEQCNLSKANAAGNLEEFTAETGPEGEGVDWTDLDRCEHCFLA